MTTEERIRPIIEKIYGANAMSEGLVRDLAHRIENHGWDDYRGREHMIMSVCWNWFSGGTTAETTARRIEQQLPSQEPS